MGAVNKITTNPVAAYSAKAASHRSRIPGNSPKISTVYPTDSVGGGLQLSDLPTRPPWLTPEKQGKTI